MKQCWSCSDETCYCYCSVCGVLYHEVLDGEGVCLVFRLGSGILFGGVQQIQLRTEEIEKGDLGVVAP